jgi:Flp pilus assembly protein TadD
MMRSVRKRTISWGIGVGSAVLQVALMVSIGSVALGQTAYVGSEKCQVCHAEFYRRWSTSHHGLAMQAYTPEFARVNLIIPDAPIAAGRSQYAVKTDPQGGWMEEVGSGRRFPIRCALGGKNIFYFLTELDRGHLQVMPLAYDVRSRSWLDSTASMTMQQFAVPSEAVDWRDRSLTFNTSCYGCHVSQLATNYDLNTDSYRSTWAEPGINCETCHGPADAHVREARTGFAHAPGDLAILSMKRMTPEQRNDACGSCHAKLTPITAEFRPGERFFDHYDLTGLESDDFYPDGRDRRENYTFTTWRMSACVQKGKLDCVHCHTSSGEYRFTAESSANDACLPCHEDKVRNAAAHTHHAAGSSGGRCISCHMPVTEYARMRRSDHSMRPPAPAATLAFGSPNACNSCHADHDAKWADEQIRKWTNPDYQSAVLWRGGMIQAARQRDWRTLPSMLDALRQNDGDEIFRASLIRLLENCRDPSVVPELVRALDDPSPLVRANAVEALADFPDVTGSLKSVARAAHDESRLVRIRAGAALASVDPARLDAPDRQPVERAVEEYVSSLETRPDDFTQHLNLGVVYADRQQPAQALVEDQAALRLRPDYAPAWVNTAFAYDALGEKSKAEDALRRAINLDPRNAAARLNLGLLLIESHRLPEAERTLKQAAELDSDDAVAPYNLALLTAAENPTEAIAWARRAAKAMPEEPKYRFTLAYLLTQNHADDEATSVLKQALAERVVSADCYRLLGELYTRRGDLAGEAALYRQAGADTRLPFAARQQFVTVSQPSEGRSN